jgi:hypothetical protein
MQLRIWSKRNDSYESIRASQADPANGCLALRFEADHEILVVFSIADQNLAETYCSDRPTPDVKAKSTSALSGQNRKKHHGRF